MGRIQGKTAIVTGAGSGIGKATVELFRREGATPWSGSHSPSGGGPDCQKTSIGIPPRGYQ